ncbi:MAG: hypothetical protein ACI8VT_001543 [Saprospiraceae bacterium]|jgi:hypothetical protein
MKAIPIILLFSLTTLFLYGQPFYIDMASQSGINHSYLFTGVGGGGVSFCDFDGDGWDDVTLATEAGKYIHFYKNNNGSFELLPTLVDDQQEVKQILWVDFDNDGDKDLYIAVFGGTNLLYKNIGNLNLVNITESAGLPLDEHRTFGACWGDYNRDGWLDLYYGERKFPADITSNECRLFKNNADGTFTEVSLQSQANDPGKVPFCSSFFDFNNDGWPDIYTANDRESINTLLKNNGDGTFSDISEMTNTNLPMDAMCVAVGDFNNNGWQDLYISNTPSGNKLLRNLSTQGGLELYEEIAEEAGVAFNGIGWGSLFFDGDNDTDLDLHVVATPLGNDLIPSTFYENQGNGSFSSPEVGFEGYLSIGNNSAIGDFDQNGYPDIMVINKNPHTSELWKCNDGNNNWYKIELEGVLSNRDGIGAKIECYIGSIYQMREIICGIGFLGQNSSTEIIGLKNHSQIDSLIVTWPTGHIDRLYEIPANQKTHLIEGSSTGGNIYVDPNIDLVIVTTKEEATLDTTVDIYPSPSRNILNLNLNTTSFNHYHILSPSGQIEKSGLIDSSNIQIDVSHLISGIHFFMLRNKEGKTMIKKWVKI